MTTTQLLRWLPAVAAAALAAGLSLSNSLWRQDNVLYDALIAHWPHRADPQLLLIAIDDRSLQSLGQWPWRRTLHARLLDRLSAAGADSVALDLILSESGQGISDDDAQLAAAMRRNGRTVLPVISSEDPEMPQELLPVPIITRAAAELGHSDIEIDADGVARGVYLRAGLGSAHWPALGAALAGRSLPPAPVDAPPYRWHRDDYIGIRYAGLPGHIAQLSYVDVLQGRVPAQVLHGRRIMVGVTATGLGQRFLTPMSNEHWMSAPEYQANVASTLLDDAAITPLTRTNQAGISALLVLLVGSGMTHLRRLRYWPWLVLPLAVIMITAGSLLWVVTSGLWFAPSASLLGLTLVAATWLVLRAARWRRQAQLDALTGLTNRHGFELALREELAKARRNGKTLALIIIDVDHFKRYNDSLGHHAGDHALKLVAVVVARYTRRPREVAARFGGDEFAMILPNTSNERARQTAARLLHDVHRLSLPTADGALPITVTMGIHSAKVDERTYESDFFEQADAALYRAKHAGRNGYACSADDLGSDKPLPGTLERLGDSTNLQ